MLYKPAIAIFFAALLMCVYGGCSSNNDRTTAVLTAMESIGVPGRIDMDGHRSYAQSGRELVSNTYTVFDMETGEIVYGPVVLTNLLNQSFIRTYILPEDAPMDADGVVEVSGDFLVTLDVEDDQGGMDSAEQVVSVDAEVLRGSSESCNATCSKSTQASSQVACTLDTGCFAIDIVDNVMDPAKKVESSIDDDTTMWIRACGAGGGRGTDNDFGADGGDPGQGGFAQTIITVAGYQSRIGSNNLVYYLGEVGEHDDSGGSGGSSTIIADRQPQNDFPLDLSDIIVIAAGGGGGGEGTPFDSGDDRGGDGGAGAFAYSKTVGESDTGIGDRGGSDSGGNGGGGTGCSEGMACGGSGTGLQEGPSGNQGLGGRSGGSGDISSEELGGDNPKGWINDAPDIAGEGQGGKGVTQDNCDGGGGGGGFGGGAGGGTNGLQCGGGGGGGSHASASTKTDTKAPDKNICGAWTNGDVVITFDLDPGA